MEVLTEQQIQAFLNSEEGGNSNGYSIGYSDGIGDGTGYGYGRGNSNGYGRGNGTGYGYGYSNGTGYGRGSDFGYDDGNGRGKDIQEFDGHKLYSIDGVPTAITSLRGNIAQGFILKRNIIKRPCFIVKENGRFAHGNTLHNAYTSLTEKLYDDSTEEERIAAFKEHFPAYDTPYPNRDLFAYHHVLTGSCRMGREQFVSSHGIDLNGSTTVRRFVELTADSYGGETVRKLPGAYGHKRKKAERSHDRGRTA